MLSFSRPQSMPAACPSASTAFTTRRPARAPGRQRGPLPVAATHASPPQQPSEPQRSFQEQQQQQQQHEYDYTSPSRRAILLACTAAAAGSLLERSKPAAAVQGITAGRIPGISKNADAKGFYTYQRPEGKSGGHGVGWSEVPRYKFKIPGGWEEVPVNVFDLGGTEIDLRYQGEQGEVNVIVAPVLRFKDVGFNASVSLEELGDPDKLIIGFAPELIGGPLPDDSVTQTEVLQKEGNTYYQWQVEVKGARKPYHYISATAVGNRCFLLSASGSGRQWRRAQDTLRYIQTSFFVPPNVA